MARERSTIDWWQEEKAARERGFSVVAGVDEAGRGPLAGPVVAACVILPFGERPAGVRDSKKMTPAQRDRSFDAIQAEALAIGVGQASPAEIDERNILRATHLAMRRAIEALPEPPSVALVDGLPVPGLPVRHIAIVKGDGRSASIAAASVIAKVTRDRLMLEMDSQFPGYGFAEHKGYPTPVHLARLREMGPCPIHRRSFAPVAEVCGQCKLPLEADARNQTGVRGEKAAADFLELHGYTILARRYRCRAGEIDLVAENAGEIAFVEVKTRHGDVSPAEAITTQKRRRIVAAAEAFLAERGLGECACRFDVVEVHPESDGHLTARLLPSAFMAGE